MTTVLDWASGALILAGVGFFGAAVVGLLRLPGVLCRLHALTKADNVSLGLIAIGLALRADSVQIVLRLGLIWLLVMAAGATTCSLIARSAVAARPRKQAP